MSPEPPIQSPEASLDRIAGIAGKIAMVAEGHGGRAAIVAPTEHLPRGVDCACVTGAGADLLDDPRFGWHGDVAWLDRGTLGSRVLREHHCSIGVRDYNVVNEPGVLVIVGAASL